MADSYSLAAWSDLMKRAQVPASTYRLQFHRTFTFADAIGILPYLRELGVGNIYASPIFAAVPGSTHGYDICDHARINPELGGEEGFDALAAALRGQGMGLVLDFVPNHMAAHPVANPWWRDVLENGPASLYADFFDIDWDPVKPELKNKILLPILGDQYGQALERGELRLEYSEGAFQIHYFDNALPVNPRQAVSVLNQDLERLQAELGSDHPDLLEFLSIRTALSNLPPYTERDPVKVEERRREKEVCRERLRRLTRANSRILEHLEANVRHCNGTPGNRESMDSLHDLLERQPYRLAYWRTALDEINYRRFFDINTLAGIRQEHGPAFEKSHAGLLRLAGEGKIQGLRLDHIDGLQDPAGYLAGLQAAIAGAREGVKSRQEKPAGRNDFYIVVEKILVLNENLPSKWPVFGTSGYDFLNDLNGIFIQSGNALPLKRVYSRFTLEKQALPEIIYHSKYAIMVDSMISELQVLAHALNRISEQDRRTRDFTLENLRRALREVVAAFPIYRTYIGPGGWTESDEKIIDHALNKTRLRHPTMEPTILQFLRDNLIPRPQEGAEELSSRRLQFAMRIQQYTAPVQAKGLEDTAFYRYNLLLSLNEVGGDPQRFGRSLQEFHQANIRRREQSPFAMTATATHDTKRGEDARARLNVLSELPEEWYRRIREWSTLNKPLKTQVGGSAAPDRNEEYFIYQTLLAAWPQERGWETVTAEFVDRIKAYLLKALREAKLHTSWVYNQRAYEEAVISFAEKLLAGPKARRFLKSFQPFQRKIAYFGMLNSLAQTTLKIGAPGVPDYYQGCEAWDLSLADPDNRRPVDFGWRQRVLDEMKPWLEAEAGERAPMLRGLLQSWDDARVKLYVTAAGLRLRRRYPELFLLGDYRPLSAENGHGDHVAVFSRSHRGQRLLVVAPRKICTLLEGEEGSLPVGPAWGECRVPLPGDWAGQELQNAFTGEKLRVSPEDAPAAALADLLKTFPAGLWYSSEAAAPHIHEPGA